jgi:DNA mismatch repair protein MutL
MAQIAGTYIMGLHGEDVWLIDMHAAHERQLMEQLVQQYTNHALLRNHLLQPIVIPERDFDHLLEQHQEELDGYGFELTQNNGSWQLLTHPRGIKSEKVLEVFMMILGFMQNDLFTVDPSLLMQEVLATIACHSAVRFSRVMTPVEMQHFLESLQSLPEVCNHGRPWKWVIARSAMDTFFMRGR